MSRIFLSLSNPPLNIPWRKWVEDIIETSGFRYVVMGDSLLRKEAKTIQETTELLVGICPDLDDKILNIILFYVFHHRYPTIDPIKYQNNIIKYLEYYVTNSELQYYNPLIIFKNSFEIKSNLGSFSNSRKQYQQIGFFNKACNLSNYGNRFEFPVSRAGDFFLGFAFTKYYNLDDIIECYLTNEDVGFQIPFILTEEYMFKIELSEQVCEENTLDFYYCPGFKVIPMLYCNFTNFSIIFKTKPLSTPISTLLMVSTIINKDVIPLNDVFYMNEDDESFELIEICSGIAKIIDRKNKNNCVCDSLLNTDSPHNFVVNMTEFLGGKKDLTGFYEVGYGCISENYLQVEINQNQRKNSQYFLINNDTEDMKGDNMIECEECIKITSIKNDISALMIELMTKLDLLECYLHKKYQKY